MFFDPATGRPKVWYFKGGEGKYELFDKPGYHPHYQKELKPVTPDIVSQIKRHLKEEMAKREEEERKKREEEEQMRLEEQRRREEEEQRKQGEEEQRRREEELRRQEEQERRKQYVETLSHTQ